MSLRLEDIELIRRLKHGYSRALDLGDFDAIGTMLTEHATIHYRGGSYDFELAGRDAIVSALRAAVGPWLAGSHTVHMPVIDVADDDTATGTWTLIDWALNLAQGNKVTAGSAVYHDRYVKRDGRWLIAHSEYDRVYERVFHEAEPCLTAHRLAAAGRA